MKSYRQGGRGRQGHDGRECVGRSPSPKRLGLAAARQFADISRKQMEGHRHALGGVPNYSSRTIHIGCRKPHVFAKGTQVEKLLGNRCEELAGLIDVDPSTILTFVYQ